MTTATTTTGTTAAIGDDHRPRHRPALVEQAVDGPQQALGAGGIAGGEAVRR